MIQDSTYKPFPRKIQVDITVQLIQKSIREEALQDFLDFIVLENPYLLANYLDNQEENFSEWLLSGGGAQ